MLHSERNPTILAAHVNLTAALAGPVSQAAQELLGIELHANGVTLRIVETEAYGGVGSDPASHAHRGPTARNRPMFASPGTLYVYFSYGMHWCANVVCGEPGTASAVLLRAGEIVSGMSTARERGRVGAPEWQLASGPARLARTLGIDGSHNGLSLLDSAAAVRLKVPSSAWPGSPGQISPDQICSGPRVGISAETQRPWRFWLTGSAAVTRYRAGQLPSV